MALMVGPIRRDLGISDTRMSLLMGLSFALFYSLLGLPIGRLADRTSRKWIITAGIAVWSLMTSLCGAARNFTQLFLARVGVGVGEAALSPPAYSLIADYFPRERLGTAIGVYSLGIYLGSGLALMLGGWVTGRIANAAGWALPLIGTLRPWQAVFVIVGLPGLVLALWVATLREPRRGAMGGATSASPLSLKVVNQYVRTHRGAFLGHNLGFGFVAMVNYSWAYWVPTWLQRVHGWTPQHVGLIYGLWTATFGVAGVVFGGWLGDQLARRGPIEVTIDAQRVAPAGGRWISRNPLPRDVVGDRQAQAICRPRGELVIAFIDLHPGCLAGKEAPLHQRDRFRLLALRILDRREVDQRGHVIGIDRQRLVQRSNRLVDLPGRLVALAKIRVTRCDIRIFCRARGLHRLDTRLDRGIVIGFQRGRGLQ